MKRLAPIVVALAAGLASAKDWAAHYAERVAAFEKENATLDAKARHVVLVGDSLTEGFSKGRLQRFLPTLAARTLNRGISSDGVGIARRGVLRRLEASVLGCRPSDVFLLIGVNDIGRDGRGVEAAARTHLEVVQKIREKLPRVRLHLVTLAPTTGGYRDMNAAIVRYNEKVRGIAAATSSSLLDLHAKLVQDGELPGRMATKDGLHWTDAVYEVYGALIERRVQGK